MYNQPQPYCRSARPKTPKNDVSNVFRIPSPLSPTFITTQSLGRLTVQKKKERVSSSPSINIKQRSQQQFSNHVLSPRHIFSDAKIKYSNNASNTLAVCNTVPASSASAVTMGDGLVNHNWKTFEPKVTKTQVYLPGDRVIFAESASAPGIPIVYRLEEERRSNPDKLNLDRRKISVCPILEGEEHLRLLNFQHNSIKKIERLSMLSKLIFLDLYDNQIEQITGLSCLKLLRVLMLGKNRVSKIENLQELVMLDVLDLHGNKISKIENVDHLRTLRVLNLAGNEIMTVNNLVGLASLSELNLRRNNIQTVYDIDELPSIQRLFLSFNEIKSFDDIMCLSKSMSLIELSLDGNPFAKGIEYKQLMVQHITNLQQLDMKKITDEEKRVACVMARREEEKRKEHERLTTMKEKRRIAINNAQRQWNQQLKSRLEESHLPSLTLGMLNKLSNLKSPRECFAIDQNALKIIDRVKSLSTSHLAEVNNNSLNLYGPGSLEAVDKDWGEKIISTIDTIDFKYINFNDIIPHLHKLCSNFQALKTINFNMNNITSLNELSNLGLLHHLDNLEIVAEGNPVTNLSLWKPYVIYSLSHLQLKTINGSPIAHSDVSHAHNIFGSISQIMMPKLDNYRLLMSQANCINLSVENVNLLTPWFGQQPSEARKVEEKERKLFASGYVNEIIQNSILADRKLKMLDEFWEKFLIEIVMININEMSDLDKYCESSLEKIKKSVKATVT